MPLGLTVSLVVVGAVVVMGIIGALVDRSGEAGSQETGDTKVTKRT